MNTLTTRSWMLCLAGVLLGGFLTGCGGSSGAVVGRDVEKRVYLLEGQDVDRPPEIVGGYATIKETQSYPQAAEEDDAYGVIWLQCTISASGVATRVRLAQGGHPALETEALNVLQRIDFRPALRNGAPTQSQIQLPIIFQGPYAKPKKSKKKKKQKTSA